MASYLTLSDITMFGEKLREILLDQYKKIPKKIFEFAPEIMRDSNNSTIRSLKAMLPDWAVEIAELSFKDPNKKIYWDPDFLEALNFTKPIL